VIRAHREAWDQEYFYLLINALVYSVLLQKYGFCWLRERNAHEIYECDTGRAAATHAASPLRPLKRLT